MPKVYFHIVQTSIGHTPYRVKRINYEVIFEYLMTRKNSIFLSFSVLLIMAAIIILGCKTNTGNTIENNNIADNTVTVDDKSFPKSFIGTWKRDNFNYTLVFTQDTLKAGNQSYTWILQSVSGNVYTIKPINSSYTGTITIKLNKDKLEISGDSAANYENNWNGIWKKQ